MLVEPPGISKVSNLLLREMPDSEWAFLRPHLALVKVETGEVLYERLSSIQYAYFPISGCISLVIDFVDGLQAEAGLVGHEGMVGVPLLHGAASDIVAAVGQAPTEVLRIPAAAFVRELLQLPVLRAMLLRYGEAMRAQAMQLAACNGHHGLDVRLARCILTLQDRHRSSELPVTHELMAGLLCTHRPSVSLAAKRLQQAGLIRYAAGHLQIVDRPKLEAVACECYHIVRSHMQTLLGRP